MIVSVSFAVYQGVRYFQGPGKPAYHVDVRRGYGQIGPSSLPLVAGPREMTDNPLAGVGMKPLNADPGQIAPPPGSFRRYAFVRRTNGEVEMLAKYRWQGSADQAAEYYIKYLEGKNMKFLGEQSRTGRTTSRRSGSATNLRPRRIFVFHGPKRRVTLTLREMSENDNTLSISLNLSCPDS